MQGVLNMMKNRTWRDALSIIFLLITGCNNQSAENPETVVKISNSNSNLPDITSALEDGGFIDLVFRIQEHQTKKDGSQQLRVAGQYKGRVVSFGVILNPAWEKNKLDKDIPVEMHWGKLSYCSVGAESDTFLEILSDLYEIKQTPKSMAKETLFAGCTLEGDPGSLASGIVKIKLFYEKGGEDDYAELYTNIDLNNHKLEMCEKDPDYRNQIIRALQGK
jgi:hypothetical protein